MNQTEIEEFLQHNGFPEMPFSVEGVGPNPETGTPTTWGLATKWTDEFIQSNSKKYHQALIDALTKAAIFEGIVSFVWQGKNQKWTRPVNLDGTD